jgi:prepilin-type N-terminal cleavage/methylation domain-containing protein
MSQSYAAQPKRSLRRGFTLIELLVVVAIIALLISILLPALSAARSASKRAVCLANLRALGLGLVEYAHENRSQMPSYAQSGEMAYRIRYKGVLSMPIPGGGTTVSPYPEVYGLNTALHTGKEFVRLQNGLPVNVEPAKSVYVPYDSKAWVCPGNPGPAGFDMQWQQQGQTYNYFVSTGKDPNFPTEAIQPSWVYNLDQTKSPTAVSSASSLALVYKSPLIWDNYNYYPTWPCMIPTQQQRSGFTVAAANQRSPHRGPMFKGNGITPYWQAFYRDGHCQMNGLNR